MMMPARNATAQNTNSVNIGQENLMPNSHNEPYLRIIEQPEKHSRFRYEREKGNHGVLNGRTSKKSFPKVKLENYQNSSGITVKASVYTNEKVPHLHVHCFKGSDREKGLKVALGQEMIATFKNLTIQHCGVKSAENVLYDTIYERLKQQSTSPVSKDRVKKEVGKIINSACICFEALKDEKPFTSPVFTEPVFHQIIGPLQIVRLSKTVSPLSGKAEVFLLCNKVNNDDIKVKFSQVNEKGIEVWCNYGEHIEVHRQCAIVFETPAYTHRNVNDFIENVEVKIQLYRPSDCCLSEALRFWYCPDEQDEQEINRKRKKKIHFDSSNEHGDSSNMSAPLSSELRFNSFDLTSQTSSPESDQDHCKRSPSNCGKPCTVSSAPSNCDPSPSNYEQPCTMSGALPMECSHTVAQVVSQSGIMTRQGDHCKRSPSNCGKPCTVSSAPSNCDPSPSNYEQPCTMSGALPMECSHTVVQVASQPGIMTRQGGTNNSTAVSSATGDIQKVENGFEEFFSDFDVEDIEDIERIIICSLSDSSNRSQSQTNKFEWQSASPRPCSQVFGFRPDSVKNQIMPQPDGNVVKLGEYFNDLSLSSPLQETESKKEPDESKGPTFLSSKQKSHFERKEKLEPKVFSALAKLIACGQMSAFIKNVRQCASVTNEDGNNLLHLALLHEPKNVLLLYVLLQIMKGLHHNAINQRNMMKQAPLHFAVLKDNAIAVKLLLAYGANPNAVDRNGNTVLHLAASHQKLDSLKAVLQHGSHLLNLDAVNHNGLTPLHLSVSSKAAECCKLLVNAGSNIDKVDEKSGRTTLHLAVQNLPSIVKFLLSQPVNVDAQDFAGNTALHLACSNQLSEVVLALMEKDADPLITNFDDSFDDDEQRGKTPYDFACGNTMLCNILAGLPLQPNQAIASNSKQSDMQASIVQTDSGYLSGSEVSYLLLKKTTQDKLEKLLNTPEEGWKKLSMFLGIDANLVDSISKLEKNPTKAVLKCFQKDGRTLTDLLHALEYAGLSAAYDIVAQDNH